MERTPIQLTPAEWQVMELLWQEPKTLMELVSQLEQTAGWAKSTVSTMLTRMEAKQLIHHTRLGRARRYFPSVTREEAAMDATSSLLNRAYQGSVGMLVNTMIRQNSLSKADIDQLYDILKEAEGK